MVDLMLTEEEQMLQTMVRDFADRELAPRARETDEKEEFSWENWNGMAKLGLMGIGIEAKYGGTGTGVIGVDIGNFGSVVHGASSNRKHG